MTPPNVLPLPAERLTPSDVAFHATLLQRRLTAPRFAHSVGVAILAGVLAERFAIDPAQARLAGILHDAAREEPPARLRELAARARYPLPPQDYLHHMRELHAPAGVTVARELFMLRDDAVLEAIRRHTFGEGALTPLGKALFIADKIEPRGRGWPNLPAGLQASLQSLDHALLFAYNLVIGELVAAGDPLDVRIIHARNQTLDRLATAP